MKNCCKVGNSAGSDCDDYRWVWMSQPSRKVPTSVCVPSTVGRYQQYPRLSVIITARGGLCGPMKICKLALSVPKKLDGCKKYPFLTGSQLGWKFYFHFFLQFPVHLPAYSGQNTHFIIHAHTHWKVKFNISWQSGCSKGTPIFTKSNFRALAGKRDLKVQGNTSGLNVLL